MQLALQGPTEPLSLAWPPDYQSGIGFSDSHVSATLLRLTPGCPTPAAQATTKRSSLSPHGFSAARDSKAARLVIALSTPSSSDRLSAPPHSNLSGCIYTLKLYNDPTSLRRQVPDSPGFPLNPCALSGRLGSLRVWHRFYPFEQPLDGTHDSELSPVFTLHRNHAHYLAWPVSVSPNLVPRSGIGSKGTLQSPAPVVVVPAPLRAYDFSVLRSIGGRA